MNIEIKNLSKSFGEVCVLKNISMNIKDKKSTIILGKSGCGKSVLLKIIYQLINYDDGEVLYGKKKKLILILLECFFSMALFLIA